ncbi:MAG: hypothetical protein B6I26_07970 [Desulfobacteraceae bacterium 4572_130]|nr:MAG: hypothetical protein B6I26_07970 [Desulfobacteraceae bacterium 4572_130]
MYLKITKSYLRTLDKKTICILIPNLSGKYNLTKEKLISLALQRPSDISQRSWASYKTFALVCGFCRDNAVFYTKAKNINPWHCVLCGKVSPSSSFKHNLLKCTEFLKIASNKSFKIEIIARKALIEQALVALISNFEIYIRTTYALILDLKHVLFGESIFEIIYKDSRNQFLNMGSINKKLKKVFSIDLKKDLGNDSFNFLSKMYSSRHVIIHNGGFKDKEYISQTGEKKSEFKKSVSIKIEDIRIFISLSKNIFKKVDLNLNTVLIDYIKRAEEFKNKHSKN